MSTLKEYKTLKIEFGRVGMYITQLVSAILGREVNCTASRDDYDYWSVTAVNDRFTVPEIASLVWFANGDPDMYRSAIPIDSNSSRSLDMSLAGALLRRAMQLEWETEFITQEALWIVGQWPDGLKVPEAGEDMIFIDSSAIRINQLWTADELVDRLFQAGGNYGALTGLCDRYQEQFGNELFWHYPMSDGKYTGVYFVLVQEGIAAISYDEVTAQDHEIFVRDSVKICSADDLNWFILAWKKNEAHLMGALEAVAFYLGKKDENAGK